MQLHLPSQHVALLLDRPAGSSNHHISLQQNMLYLTPLPLQLLNVFWSCTVLLSVALLPN